MVGSRGARARACLLCVLAFGCVARKDAPHGAVPDASDRKLPAAAPSASPPPPADALGTTFAADVVGQIVPMTPVAGEYAMSLTMTFVHFVTTEVRLDERRTGVFRITLAADGTARACLGSRGDHESSGQMHYEKDPAKRRHESRDDVGLLALDGQWKVADGVATITFDRESRGACDLANARKMEPSAERRELRCVGIARGDAPGGVVAQVWRDGSRQVRLARLLGSGLIKVQPLDHEEAQATGSVCGKSGTSDVIDASVVLLARKHRAPVVTSDAGDLTRIDPTLELITC